jgi:hypothetical protein
MIRIVACARRRHAESNSGDPVGGIGGEALWQPGVARLGFNTDPPGIGALKRGWRERTKH